GATLDDGHIEPVPGVQSRGQRLIEAAVFGLRLPIGDEGDVGEGLALRRRGPAAATAGGEGGRNRQYQRAFHNGQTCSPRVRAYPIARSGATALEMVGTEGRGRLGQSNDCRDPCPFMAAKKRVPSFIRSLRSAGSLSAVQHQAAAVNMMRPSLRAFLCGRATISTSRSKAVRKTIRRSTEYSRELPLNRRDPSGWLIPMRSPAFACVSFRSFMSR